MSWSGGKDSAFCLYQLLRDTTYEVTYLLSIINRQSRQITLHGIPESLIEDQAKSIGIPLLKIYIEPRVSNAAYEQSMRTVLLQLKAEGIHQLAFGDIFLEDLRKYREQNLSKIGMQALFPLWGIDSRKILIDFLAQGFKSFICCTDSKYFDESDLGQVLDEEFLSRLPDGVDSCGENGEFHTFCFDGPIFKYPVTYSICGRSFVEIPVTANQKAGFWIADFS